MHFRNTMFAKVLASSAAAMIATTSLYAIPKGPCDPKPADVCCDEPKPGPFGFAFPMDMGLACPRDFYVHIDGLAFQAKQFGMEFVVQDSSGTNGAAPVAPLTNGRVEGFSNDHTDWDFNFGMRFGVGFFLDHDAWNLDFNWTWLNITDYKHANASNLTGILIPLWTLGINTTAATIGKRSSAVWDTAYNTVDARLGKPYHVSRYLTLSPHIGTRFGWIDQHFSVDYQGAFPTTGRTIHHADNDFWGIGIRTGVDTDWVLGKGWSLFGNLAIAMLYGKFEIDQNMTQTDSDGFDIKFDFYQNVPNFEMALGLCWGRYFDKMKYHVALKAAYEFHEWWSQLNLRKFYSNAANFYVNDTVSRGDFTLNGFSLRLQLDI